RAPRVLSAGSTPAVAPDLHPPGVPLVGSSTSHPSFRRSRIEVIHFGVRSGLTATMYDHRLLKCARLTVKIVPSAPIAGAALTPGRCDPHGMLGGIASGEGGHGRSLSLNAPRHRSDAAGVPGLMEL